MNSAMTESNHPARWWTRLPDGRIECRLCPRFCKLNEGQRGFCFVRQNFGGQMVLTTYGRSSGFCIDPIEKKPLNHFYPGTSVLSFGTAGCNLGCRFCQNWDISKARAFDRLADAGLAGSHRRRRAPAGLPVGRLHLQRSGDLRRIRDGCGGCLPGAGIAAVAVTAGYMTGRFAPGILPAHGRGQRGFERVHRGVLPPLNASANSRRCWTR